MKIVEQNKWVPCDGIVLEESANFVARSQEDILVVAGPGAGKTELLAQKASYLFQTNTCNEPQKKETFLTKVKRFFLSIINFFKNIFNCINYSNIYQDYLQ